MWNERRREGSIPLIMLVVMLLSAGAAASLFMSQGTARMEHRFGLKTQADALAQAAAEEIMVRLTNASATWDPDAKSLFAYKPHATLAIAQEIEDRGIQVEISDVEVMGRLAEAPNNAAAAKDFEELLAIGPNFGVHALEAKGIDPKSTRWVDHLVANKPAWAELAFVDEIVSEKLTLEGVGEEYYEEYVEEYHERDAGSGDDYGDFNANDENDRNAAVLKRRFEALPYEGGDTGSNPYLTTGASGLSPVDDWNTIPLDESGWSQILSVDPDRESQLELFMEAWDETMDGVGDQVALRIKNCNGNLNYGFGSMIGSFTLGAGPEADQDEEEDFRNAGEDGGNLDYKSTLVSVRSNVTVASAGVKSSQSHLAHRLVSSTNASKAAAVTREQTMLYLMYVYNFTPHDFAYLADRHPEKYAGMVALETDASGTVSGMKPLPGLWTKLFERHHDLVGVKVVPFEAANCTARTKGA